MRIVVTGYGIVSAIGVGKEAVRDSLRQEQSGIGRMQQLQSVHDDLPVGEVPLSNAQLCARLGLAADAVISRTSLLGLLAAREAMEQSGLTNTEQMAFASGTTVGGMDTTERYYAAWQQGEHLEYVGVHEAGSSTERIAERLGQFAYMTTPSTACSSALNAIIWGANLIKTKRAEAALVGGTECLSRFHLNGFHSLMILDHEPCRPFDATRRGLNLGEGAAYFVIESEESARARGAEILAYVSGYGNACDAFHQTASSENGEGAYLAMTKALQMACLEPREIDYVNAHGTGTPNNDASESAAMRRVWGEQLPPISSTKSMTGHTTSASGSIEAAICMLCMEESLLPTNLGWQQADEACIVPIQQNVSHVLRHIVCNSFGFGGNDSSLILSAPTEKVADEQNAILDLSEIQVLSDVCLEEDVDYKPYISPMDARRLTKQLRRTLVAAKMAMAEAGLEQVDAVITGTQWGCIDNSVRFLKDMLESGETLLKPTYFMQSTHNTLSSLVAIHTHTHGYNCTYSHGAHSMDDAMLDAKMQMELGYIRSALVIGFDETNDDWQDVLGKCGRPACAKAHAMVLKRL